MVSRWFACLIYALIALSCGLLIPDAITRAYWSLVKWCHLLAQHPMRALRSLWDVFWNSWLAVGTTAGLLYTMAFVPDIIGFGTAKAFFVIANLLFVVRLCMEEGLQGPKGNRKDKSERAVIIGILLVFFGFVSFVECGMITNRERGLPATGHNIWAASRWWTKAIEAPPIPQKVPFNEPEPTLRSLMMAFGPNAFRTVKLYTLSFPDGAKVTFEVVQVLDYPAGSKFMMVYIPSFKHTCAAAKITGNRMKQIRGDFAAFKATARSPGESPQTTNSLVDAGRVYLYEEDFLNHRQMADIEAAYTKQGLHVELRGPDYLTNAQVGWAQRKYGK